MEKTKRERLKANGWRVGDAADFLGLTPEEIVVLDRLVEQAKHKPKLNPSENSQNKRSESNLDA